MAKENLYSSIMKEQLLNCNPYLTRILKSCHGHVPFFIISEKNKLNSNIN